MDERQSLEQLISRGEGQSLDFKAAVPSPEHLARLIAAFANSGGGTILLGAREDGSTPGVLRSDVEDALRSAIQRLTPPPEVLLTTVPASWGQPVARIDVAEEPTGPVAAPDGLFRRYNGRIEALPADTIRERALNTVTSDLQKIVTPLASTLESLTQRMLDLERQVAAAQGWKRRLPDILLGAVISAVLGLILALLFL
jgi:predicted HTH transcriptional regulator